MAKSDNIFYLYSENLHLLVDNGFLAGIELKYDHTYICPLCCSQFGVDDTNTKKENHLTLEDAPPKSLGGTANILTCKQCNNIAGYKVDSHLAAGLRAKDAREFRPGSESRVKFQKDGQQVQGFIRVENDGTIKASNSYKDNHPVKLDTYIKSISPKTGENMLSLEFASGKIDNRRLQIGLLKTAYLLCFEKFGYKFIFNPECEKIRQQIKTPDQEIYPLQFWFTGPFKPEHEGVHIVKNPGLECLMPIFSLKTAVNRTFAAIIPLKNVPILETVAGFHARLSYNLGYADFQKFANPSGYLSDLDAIVDLDNFVKTLN